jgi:putative ABC transport system ATP-binding protein
VTAAGPGVAEPALTETAERRAVVGAAGDTPEHDWVIVTRGLTRQYDMGGEIVRALRGVDLAIRRNEYVAIMGPSGSGKSTLMNLIGCLDTPNGGEYWLNGTLVSRMSDDELARVRNKEIGFVFQTFNLLPRASALQNVELPLVYAGIPAEERRRRAAEALTQVQLGERMHHRPNELSGGQRQRVAIARALVTHPAIVLADEPTANLDHKTGEGILTLMRDINRHLKTTFIFSTHDKKVIDSADRLIGIEDGRIRLVGTRKDGQWDITSLRRTSATPSPAPTPASRKATRIMGSETGLMGTHTELMATRPERTP